jgi:hypothetical protein
MTIEKFDPNPVLININKLKPYIGLWKLTHYTICFS